MHRSHPSKDRLIAHVRRPKNVIGIGHVRHAPALGNSEAAYVGIDNFDRPRAKKVTKLEAVVILLSSADWYVQRMGKTCVAVTVLRQQRVFPPVHVSEFGQAPANPYGLTQFVAAQ